MSDSRSIVLGCGLGAVLGAGLGAAMGAAGGAIGAKVMIAAGKTGYDITQAVKMGALGSGLLYGAFGGCASSSKGVSLTGFAAGQLLGSLVGYGILKTSITMTLGTTAIASTVGAAVLGGGLGVLACVTAVCVAPCIAAASSQAKNSLSKYGLFSKTHEATPLEPDLENQAQNTAPAMGLGSKT